MPGAKPCSPRSQTNRSVTTEPSPLRGEVWMVAFDPSIGGEIKKTRPAVVVSNGSANAVLNRVQVIPISSQVQRLYPAEAYVSLDGNRRKAMADQLTTASKRRLLRRLGVLGPEDVEAVNRVNRRQLDL
nr:type II toxin-antitoxin system PemK/MazF family toxin [uncultured Rhodopila sp.]